MQPSSMFHSKTLHSPKHSFTSVRKARSSFKTRRCTWSDYPTSSNFKEAHLFRFHVPPTDRRRFIRLGGYYTALRTRLPRRLHPQKVLASLADDASCNLFSTRNNGVSLPPAGHNLFLGRISAALFPPPATLARPCRLHRAHFPTSSPRTAEPPSLSSRGRFILAKVPAGK